MKKLFIASVLALTLTFPFVSHAGVNIFGVETPIEKNEVNDNLGHGYVAGDLGDTFHVQKPNSKAGPVISGENKDMVIVFGVDINSINKI